MNDQERALWEAQQSGMRSYLNNYQNYLRTPDGVSAAARERAVEEQRRRDAVIAEKGYQSRCRIPECDKTGWTKQEGFCDQHWSNLHSWVAA